MELAKLEVRVMSEAVSVLAEERKKQGKTVQDIEEATHIRREFIEAIEAGRLERLPRCYGAYFVRDYAEVLKIDANLVLGDLEAAQEGDLGPRIAESARLPIPVLASFGNREKRGKRYALGAAVSLLILFVVGILNWNWADRPLRDVVHWKSLEVPSPKVRTESDKGSPEKAQPVPVAPVPSGSAPAAVSLRLWVGGESSWVRVKADEQIVYEGVLFPGSYQEWKGSNKLEIRLGNAGAVRVQVNEKELGALGSSGQVITRTFTPQTAL